MGVISFLGSDFEISWEPAGGAMKYDYVLHIVVGLQNVRVHHTKQHSGT